MKKIISKIFLVTTSLFLMTIAASAQKGYTEKPDKVIFLNGTVKEGRVLAFADEKIRFAHTGETLNYEFNKKEIEKIEFASGRTEVLTQREVLTIPPVKIISKNWVAVIPMQYTGYGNEERKDDMGFYLQEIASSYLAKSTVELKIMDAAEVNALLLKNGAIDSNIRRYTAKELAAMLHVEYVIIGSVLQDNGTVVTNSIMNKTKKADWWNGGEYKRKENAHQQTVTNQLVETHVTLSIYNEAGEKIYTKSRQSLLSERDAYKNTIHYLLKRTFLYKK
jgi:hypothetical protein